MKLAKTVVLAALAATGASAQANLGAQKPEASLPFVMTQVATFNLPWRLAFLPESNGGVSNIVLDTTSTTPANDNTSPTLPRWGAHIKLASPLRV
jgi:hypothetical protein